MDKRDIVDVYQLVLQKEQSNALKDIQKALAEQGLRQAKEEKLKDYVFNLHNEFTKNYEKNKHNPAYTYMYTLKLLKNLSGISSGDFSQISDKGFLALTLENIETANKGAIQQLGDIERQEFNRAIECLEILPDLYRYKELSDLSSKLNAIEQKIKDVPAQEGLLGTCVGFSGVITFLSTLYVIIAFILYLFSTSFDVKVLLGIDSLYALTNISTWYFAGIAVVAFIFCTVFDEWGERGEELGRLRKEKEAFLNTLSDIQKKDIENLDKNIAAIKSKLSSMTIEEAGKMINKTNEIWMALSSKHALNLQDAISLVQTD